MNILKEYIQKDSQNKNRIFCNLLCPNCNKVFVRQKRLIKSKYCSRQCKSEYEVKVTLCCANCKITFKRFPSKMKSASNNLHFCSRACKDEGQKNIVEIQPSHYGTGEESYRTKAFRSYKPICNRCSFSNILALEVHHLDRDRENNEITNLEILCANCHTVAHKLDYNKG